MKETPLSLCEKHSVIQNIRENRRLDGRGMMEMRKIDIQFGKDYGCCTVSLGETRVLAQVTAEVVEPRPSRPNEGRLSIGVHIPPMAASHFELGRCSDIIDECQQILDRNIKESKCVDLESLCILAEESVWQFKVDVTILNHAGNLGDAANIAAVAALRHFHRPDVTVEEDGRVTIHTKEEREFIPTFLKKIPVCVSYSIFPSQGNKPDLAIDPTEKEERVASGKLSVGMNPHGEITSLLFPGKICVKKSLVLGAVNKAFVSAKSIAENIGKLIDDELQLLKSNTSVTPMLGFIDKLKSDKEYNKKLVDDRLDCFKGVDRSALKKETEECEEEPMESTSLREETNNTVPSSTRDSESSSDEEFPPELLTKSLSEIKALKKVKKSAKKRE